MRTDDYETIAGCLKRAAAGKTVTVGFIGGSITQGSLASEERFSYAYRVYQWWQETFPNTAIKYVNAGIGGTSSHFGAARVGQDLLVYQPDIVVVDFSVNDEANAFCQETFEGLIRQILMCPFSPAVIVLNNVFYDTGLNAQEFHNIIAAHYQIPCVSIRDSIFLEVKKGIYKVQELTPDNLHPNDRGHGLVADQIIKLLERIHASEICPSASTSVNSIRKPYTANGYEKAQRINITNSIPLLEGFEIDTDEKKGYLDIYKNGWIARKEGDAITFEIECSRLAVQYRKSIHKPVPVAELALDGEDDLPHVLDGNFAEEWGDCLYLQNIIQYGERKKRRISIRIIKGVEQQETPFYLTALIVA